MTGERYRAGPWPGLTPRGAAVLLGCALLLAVGLAAWGSPRQPLPDLPILAIVSLAPLALATRIVSMPGAASAACGAYLLPRSLLSLIDPGLEPPPLLLIPAVAFDVCAWLRPTDVSNLKRLWPASRPGIWRRRSQGPRRLGGVRAAGAGSVFGAVVALVQPPLAVLLGGDPAIWSDAAVWPAVCLSAAGCALVGLIGRDTKP